MENEVLAQSREKGSTMPQIGEQALITQASVAAFQFAFCIGLLGPMQCHLAV